MRARLWKSTSTLELGTAITATTQYKYIERIKKIKGVTPYFFKYRSNDDRCNLQLPAFPTVPDLQWNFILPL